MQICMLIFSILTALGIIALLLCLIKFQREAAARSKSQQELFQSILNYNNAIYAALTVTLPELIQSGLSKTDAVGQTLETLVTQSHEQANKLRQTLNSSNETMLAILEKSSDAVQQLEGCRNNIQSKTESIISELKTVSEKSTNLSKRLDACQNDLRDKGDAIVSGLEKLKNGFEESVKF